MEREVSVTPSQFIYDAGNDGSGGQAQNREMQFEVNDLGATSPAGIYVVRMVASYAKNSHDSYGDIVYDFDEMANELEVNILRALHIDCDVDIKEK